ncbi:MAG: DEAD/DEAH box helicase [Gammaproteobacteria bacterium]|nr:DEAD/DEAH box helicase [Gammaproteobacteria bacterium]
MRTLHGLHFILKTRKTVDNFQKFNLDSNIYKAINACGYTTPTPVQTQSIPVIMGQQDVVVSAQTGTGKTAAFVLPALHRLIAQPSSKKARILILTPTRELAGQITKAANMYGKFMQFNIVSLVGGMPYHHQIKDLKRGADIIVATPGRLLDHIEQKHVDLSNIAMLVLDEADRMLDMGFIDDVQYIAKLTPTSRQTLLFSATLDNKLMNAVKHLLRNPARIDLSNEKIAAPQIKQEMYKANNAQHKSRLLKHFLHDKAMYKAIIFSATKINADKLANQLRDEGFAAAALHGDLRQNVRNRTLEQLRRGKIQFLVATDVAARGIDVHDITHVINYDLPRFSEDYVHRIGRTGRAGKAGIAISFVLPTDMRHLQSIERYIGQRIKLIHTIEISDAPAPNKKIEHTPEILTLPKKPRFSRDKQDRNYKHEKPAHSKAKFKNDYHPEKKNFSRKKNHKDNNKNLDLSLSDTGKRRVKNNRDNNNSSFKKRPVNKSKDRRFSTEYKASVNTRKKEKTRSKDAAS